jgi:hypothetical protein
MQQGFFSVQQTCPRCHGAGKMITDPCGSCHGQGRVEEHKTLSVKVPAGVDTGDRIRLSEHFLDPGVFIRSKDPLPTGTKVNLRFTVIMEEIETIEDVEYRMKRDSIGRRNLTPAIMSRFRAEMVAYHVVSKGKGTHEAVKIVSTESSVSTRQVYRDVERAELVEKVADEVRPATDTMSLPAIKELVKMPKPKQKAVAKKADGDGKKIEKEIKKAKGREKPSAARLFDAMQRQHFSGKTGLPQTIHAMADANGGKGAQFKTADESLNGFLKATTAMRDGKL